LPPEGYYYMEQDTPPQAVGSANPGWLPRWEIIALALGDMIALLLFAAIGRDSHALTAENPFLSTMNTAMPFVLSWIISGMITGHYRGAALFPLWRVAVRTSLTGLIGGPLGVIFRSIYLARPVIWTFVLVATAASTAIMLIWRIAWSRVRRVWWRELP
jgi:hypothetical protein